MCIMSACYLTHIRIALCRYEILMLKVIHRRRRTGFEETKDFPIRVSDLIAGRYQVGRPPTSGHVWPDQHRHC